MIHTATGLLAAMDMSAHIGSAGGQLFLYSCFNEPVEVLPGAVFELEQRGQLTRYTAEISQVWYLIYDFTNYRPD